LSENLNEKDLLGDLSVSMHYNLKTYPKEIGFEGVE
jgi:hypothetical protein